MFSKKAWGVGLCAAFLAASIAMSQTAMSQTGPSQQAAATGAYSVPEPLEFVVLNTSPLLQLPGERVALQLDYARSKGFVQYSLGQDSNLRNALVERVSRTYGMPMINAYGQFEWRVQNPDPNSPHAAVIRISIGEKIQTGYFIKADGRRSRQVVTRGEPQKKSPIVSGYRSPAAPQIRGRHDTPLKGRQ